MPNTTNFNFPTPADTDLVKDGAAAIRSLGNSIDTAFVDLKGGTTGQILSKASNTDLDYTWITNDVGDITAVTAGTGISGGGSSGAVTITNDMATTITASGDIVVGTGSGTYDNLPIGTTGQVLTADTTVSPYKVKWAAAAGGGKVLQVVSTTYSTSTAITTTAYADTGLSLAITPSSATSKVLVMVSQNCYTQADQSDAGGGLRLMRDSTAIFADANTYTLYTYLSGNSATKGVATYLSFNYLDSPNTTSSVTYKTQGRVNTGNNSERFVANNDGWSSTITLLEIGA